jgi:hypothetical protein
MDETEIIKSYEREELLLLVLAQLKEKLLQALQL